ncbi:MAG: hypothetical protein ISS95_00650 [Candidatus Aenigmarchaeota archaeon]|nr:hypothetical protein [Candidatus Aenigmarchaeota archaeon]
MRFKYKALLYLFVGFIVFSIIHNAVYSIFNYEEPLFFILSIASIIGFIILFIYDSVIYFSEKLRVG